MSDQESKTTNTSGVHPLGHAVLLKTYEMKTGRIELPESVRDRLVMAEQRATVVEVGPCAWEEEIRNGHPPRALPGEKVMFSKYAGFAVPGDDGTTYRVVNDRDIFMKVEK